MGTAKWGKFKWGGAKWGESYAASLGDSPAPSSVRLRYVQPGGFILKSGALAWLGLAQPNDGQEVARALRSEPPGPGQIAGPGERLLVLVRDGPVVHQQAARVEAGDGGGQLRRVREADAEHQPPEQQHQQRDARARQEGGQRLAGQHLPPRQRRQPQPQPRAARPLQDERDDERLHAGEDGPQHRRGERHLVGGARPRLVKARGGEVASFVQGEMAKAKAESRELLVYVGATWCEPCQRFHEALEAGKLDAAFPNFTFVEFDFDEQGDGLKRAGYVSRLIPLFAVPGPDGRASGRQMEGGIKGDGAVAELGDLGGDTDHDARDLLAAEDRTRRGGRLATGVEVGGGKLFLIAGPCVVESESHALKMAEAISAITASLGIPYIFKSSF